MLIYSPKSRRSLPHEVVPCLDRENTHLELTWTNTFFDQSEMTMKLDLDAHTVVSNVIVLPKENSKKPLGLWQRD